MTAPSSGDRRVLVMATAGHVDHGKSALVTALTGIDPDRLLEEKRREMTIDLGFAYADLSVGRVAFVDVPGHTRFMRNMLAGVQGIDAALFVIAADDGPMPQTREHLSVLGLLGVELGIVVLTKCDLVADDWLEMVTDEVSESMAHSSLRDAPVVQVSSRTGLGLDRLRAEIERLMTVAPRHPDQGLARFPIDRVFSVRGFGTVVTGTLSGGSLVVGQRLMLLPQRRLVRVRGLQQHSQPVEFALPGSRTAVNLADVDRKEVDRGDVLAEPGLLTATSRFDARVRTLPDSSLSHEARVLVYHGTAEVGGQVLLLSGRELAPGAGGMVQVRLDSPVVAAFRDRFILRSEGAGITVAGGEILDVDPVRQRLRDERARRRLARLETADPKTLLRMALEESEQGIPIQTILAATGAGEAGAAALDELVRSEECFLLGDTVIGSRALDKLELEVRATVERYHEHHNLAAGMARESARSTLGLQRQFFTALVQRMVAASTLVETENLLAVPQLDQRPTPAQQQVIDAALDDLRDDPFRPPSSTELSMRWAVTSDIVHFLVAQGILVQPDRDTVILASAWSQALDRVREHLGREGTITLGEAKRMLGANRRFVLPLLDRLDANRETVRIGDEHRRASTSATAG